MNPQLGIKTGAVILIFLQALAAAAQSVPVVVPFIPILQGIILIVGPYLVGKAHANLKMQVAYNRMSRAAQKV